jgi:hypothetical protein
VGTLRPEESGETMVRAGCNMRITNVMLKCVPVRLKCLPVLWQIYAGLSKIPIKDY